VRVEIDPGRKNVVGLAISPQRVAAVRLDLLGRAVAEPEARAFRGESQLSRTAAELVGRHCNADTAAVGISSPGLVDEGELRLLLSSSAPSSPGLSLDAVLGAIGDLPVALENDMNALGDVWRIDHPDAIEQTVLLVSLGDGRVGSSLMVAGGPADAGCVRGGNELGHMQVPAMGRAVPPCFCGQNRCLERAFSSRMVQRLTDRPRRLATVLRRAIAEDPLPDPEHQEMLDEGAAGAWVLHRLFESVANAVNFGRPHRVVWTAPASLAELLPELAPVLDRQVRRRLLPALGERVAFEVWSPHTPRNDGEASPPLIAGHLALSILTGRRTAADPTPAASEG
jgi:predicted NBD/HSP70 family sugar kinase